MRTGMKLEHEQLVRRMVKVLIELEKKNKMRLIERLIGTAKENDIY